MTDPMDAQNNMRALIFFLGGVCARARVGGGLTETEAGFFSYQNKRGERETCTVIY